MKYVLISFLTGLIVRRKGLSIIRVKLPYRKVFDMGNVQKKFSHAGERFVLDLGDVKHVASVRLMVKNWVFCGALPGASILRIV